MEDTLAWWAGTSEHAGTVGRYAPALSAIRADALRRTCNALREAVLVASWRY